MISVIIVSFNTSGLLRECLASLAASTRFGELETFVVDNNSADDSVAMVTSEFPWATVIANRENLGFAAANNQAWQLAQGDYVLLLNPDAYVKPDAIARAVDFMERTPDCGICGGRLVKPNGSLDPSARRFPNFLAKFFTLSGLRYRFPESSIFSRHEFGGFDHNSVLEVDWVPGTFTLYRNSMLEKLRLFDERFYIYYEETDVCLAAKRNGWKVYFIPDAEVVHVGGAASKTRKDHQYDEHANQLIQFRMRSEWLYFRKNSGLGAVLANAGVEYLWHGLRYLANLLPGRSEGAAKRKYSAMVLGELTRSLRITGFGRQSPQTPW